MNVPLFKTKGDAWFTMASIAHLLITMCITWLVQPYTKNHIMVATMLHATEEWLENNAIFSVEGIWSRLSGCTHEGWLEQWDSDTVQNISGDILSGLVGSLIAAHVIERPPTHVILLTMFSIGMVYTHVCKKLNREKVDKVR